MFLSARTGIFPTFSSIRGVLSLHHWRDKVPCCKFLPLSRGSGRMEGVMGSANFRLNTCRSGSLFRVMVMGIRNWTPASLNDNFFFCGSCIFLQWSLISKAIQYVGYIFTFHRMKNFKESVFLTSPISHFPTLKLPGSPTNKICSPSIHT